MVIFGSIGVLGQSKTTLLAYNEHENIIHKSKTDSLKVQKQSKIKLESSIQKAM